MRLVFSSNRGEYCVRIGIGRSYTEIKLRYIACARRQISPKNAPFSEKDDCEPTMLICPSPLGGRSSVAIMGDGRRSPLTAWKGAVFATLLYGNRDLRRNHQTSVITTAIRTITTATMTPMKAGRERPNDESFWGELDDLVGAAVLVGPAAVSDGPAGMEVELGALATIGDAPAAEPVRMNASTVI